MVLLVCIGFVVSCSVDVADHGSALAMKVIQRSLVACFCGCFVRLLVERCSAFRERHLESGPVVGCVLFACLELVLCFVLFGRGESTQFSLSFFSVVCCSVSYNEPLVLRRGCSDPGFCFACLVLFNVWLSRRFLFFILFGHICVLLIILFGQTCCVHCFVPQFRPCII